MFVGHFSLTSFWCCGDTAPCGVARHRRSHHDGALPAGNDELLAEVRNSDCGANCDELAELLNYNNIESLTADGPPKYWICL